LEIYLFGQVPHVLTIWGALLIVVSLATIAIEKQRDTIRNSKKGMQEDDVSPSRPKSATSMLSTVDDFYRYGAINIRSTENPQLSTPSTKNQWFLLRIVLHLLVVPMDQTIPVRPRIPMATMGLYGYDLHCHLVRH
jgi:hypothetical protein